MNLKQKILLTILLLAIGFALPAKVKAAENVVTYSAGESGTYNPSTGTTQIVVELWGGGAGGGAGPGNTNGAGGGGGGGGAYVIKTISSPSSSYSYSVGTAGNGGSVGNPGDNGGSTTFDSGTYTAAGGTGGSVGPLGAGGAGGSGSGGDTNRDGGDGATAISAQSGGGGGGAGTDNPGGDAGTPNVYTPGTGGSSLGGDGGDGCNTGSNCTGGNADTASVYGGGGGGGMRNAAGGNGAGGYIRITETIPGTSISGVIRQTDESSAFDCSSGGPYTVRLRVDGSGTYSGDCTASSGAWAVSDVTLSSGQTIYAYIYNETPKGSTVLVATDSSHLDVDIFQNRVILRDEVNGSITNSEILAGNTADADDLITTSGTDVTVSSSYETHIYSGDTYAPGANVTTGKLHVVGTYTGSTETLTLTGTGTGTSRPLYVDGGSFTAPSTTDFEGDGDVGVEGTTYNALTFTPTITAGRAYSFTGAATINGNFTSNPTAASAQTLTVNLGGTTAVGSSYTTTLTGTTSGVTTLDTRPVSTDYNLSTGLLNIASGSTLDAGSSASTITLTGTAGTLWTNGGTFTEGSSTVIMNPDAAVTLFSADPGLYNLTLSPTITSGRTYTVGSGLTIGGDFNMNPSAGSSLALTVNMGGDITVAATGTTTLTGAGAGPATTTVDMRPVATDYDLSTGLLSIASGSVLDAGSSASLVTLTGTSGTLWTHNGTFTEGGSTVTFTPDADVTLFSANPTLNDLTLSPTITAGRAYGIGTALTINGDFEINPTAASSLALTVNAGGNITQSATSTLTLTGTTSGTSTLDLRPASTDYNIDTGFINIASAGTLDADAAASTIDLNGTSSTLFTVAGSFSQGNSTVTVTNASGTPTLNSGTVTFYNLTIDPSNLTINTSADNITVSNTLNIASGDTLNLASGQTLTVSTTLTLDGTISDSGGELNYTSTSDFPTTGTITAALTLDATNGNINVPNPANDYGGALTIYNNSASTRTVTLASGTIDVTGNLTLNANNTGGISLTGDTNDPDINIGGNLTGTNGGGTEDLTTGSGTWTVTGNVDLTDVGTFTATDGNVFQMNGGSTTLTSAGESFHTFIASGGSPSTADAMTVNGNFAAAGTASFTHAVGDMDVNGTFSASDSATFVHAAGADIDIYIAGDLNLASGTSWTENTTSTSQVIFNGDLTYTDNAGVSIGNVVIGNSPDTTYLSTDASANSLTINSTDYYYTCGWEVDIGNGGITINGTFDATSDEAGCSVYDTGDPETTINDANLFNLSGTGTFVPDQSTIIFDDSSGTNALTTAGTGTFYNMEVNGASNTMQLADALDVDNDLTITAGTLDLNGSNQLNVGGNFDNDDGFEAGTGKVVFDADSGTKTIDALGGSPDEFYDVEFNQGTSATWQLTTAMEVDNDFTITDGTVDVNGANQITVTGNWDNTGGTFTASTGKVLMNAQDSGNTLSGTMTGTSSFYDLEFNDSGTSGAWTFGNNSATVTHDFLISGGTVTAPGSGYTLTIAEDFTNNDGFTHNSGEVAFNSTANSYLLYTGNTTFYDLSITTSGSKQVYFDEAQETIITDNGSLTIQGTDCANLVYLDSNVDDNPWDLNVSTTGTTIDIDYADVEDSNSTNPISADSSTEVNGGNTNWSIDEGTCSASGLKPRFFGGVRGLDGVRIK
ncbi:hypothetical protein JXA63_05640 [Candidatus Woesebacteria bacterium]|nr:hypothetical protein [Candidatus Woesebacteria bacterium]